MWSLVVRFEAPFCHSHFGASIQLDYVFLPSEIPVPVPTPIVDEHHEVIGLASADNNARIGLARAEVSINEEMMMLSDWLKPALGLITLFLWRTFGLLVRVLTF